MYKSQVCSEFSQNKTVTADSGTFTPGLAVGDFDENGSPDLVATVGHKFWIFSKLRHGKRGKSGADRVESTGAGEANE